MDRPVLIKATRTFNAGKDKIRVQLRAVQPERPSGLMSVGWRWPGFDVNATVGNTKHGRIGSLGYLANGNFYWTLGSEKPYWDSFNTLNKDCCAKYNCGPHSYKTPDFALDHMKDYIQCYMLDDMESWHP